MILDYKNNLENALENGIEKQGNTICFKKEDDDRKFEGITFKNFPNLYLEDCELTNCTFENCDELNIDESIVKECTFLNIPNIYAVRTDFCNCTFKDVETEEFMLSMDTYGDVDGCTFENIRIKENVGKCAICDIAIDGKKDFYYITNCSFINCSLENEYDELSVCTYKNILGKEEIVGNVDYETCEIVK